MGADELEPYDESRVSRSDGGPAADAGTDAGMETCVPEPESCNELDDDCDDAVDESSTSPAIQWSMCRMYDLAHLFSPIQRINAEIFNRFRYYVCCQRDDKQYTSDLKRFGLRSNLDTEAWNGVCACIHVHTCVRACVHTNIHVRAQQQQPG